MACQVVLVSEGGMEGWFGQSALKRADFEIHATSDYKAAFQLILRTDCRLVVAEDWPGCAHFQEFLSELLFSIKKEDLKVILLTNSMPPGPGRPPIAHVVPVPSGPDAFDPVLIDVLGMRQRASKRHLIRIHTSPSSREELNLGLAVCLVLNAGGMLVECPKTFPTGKALFWSFQSIPQLKGTRVPGTILREEPPQPGSRAHVYAVAFDEDAIEERTHIALYLDGSE